MGHEEMQQFEFGRAKMDGQAIARNGALIRVEGDAGQVDDFTGFLGSAAAQQGIDASHQFTR